MLAYLDGWVELSPREICAIALYKMKFKAREIEYRGITFSVLGIEHFMTFFEIVHDIEVPQYARSVPPSGTHSR